MIHVAGCAAAHFLPNAKCKGVWEYWNGFRWLPDNTVKITCTGTILSSLTQINTFYAFPVSTKFCYPKYLYVFYVPHYL